MDKKTAGREIVDALAAFLEVDYRELEAALTDLVIKSKGGK